MPKGMLLIVMARPQSIDGKNPRRSLIQSGLSSWTLSELQISKSHSDCSEQGSVPTQSTKALCGPAMPQGDSPSQSFLVVVVVGSWNRRDSLKAGFSPELGSAVFLPLDCSMTLTPEGHRAKPPCDVTSLPTQAGKGEAEIAEAEGGHLRWVGMTSPSLSCL